MIFFFHSFITLNEMNHLTFSIDEKANILSKKQKHEKFYIFG